MTNPNQQLEPTISILAAENLISSAVKYKKQAEVYRKALEEIASGSIGYRKIAENALKEGGK